MDGSGYPSGLVGEEICLEARIICIADVIEAVASDRPYRAALGLDYALDEIAAEPDRYDPAAVAACLALYAKGKLEFLSVHTSMPLLP
jgi:HD-GYP domain-containing protein (c-di-GMP phosphodiesterase class II)